LEPVIRLSKKGHIVSQLVPSNARGLSAERGREGRKEEKKGDEKRRRREEGRRSREVERRGEWRGY